MNAFRCIERSRNEDREEIAGNFCSTWRLLREMDIGWQSYHDFLLDIANELLKSLVLQLEPYRYSPSFSLGYRVISDNTIFSWSSFVGLLLCNPSDDPSFPTLIIMSIKRTYRDRKNRLQKLWAEIRERIVRFVEPNYSIIIELAPHQALPSVGNCCRTRSSSEYQRYE